MFGFLKKDPLIFAYLPAGLAFLVLLVAGWQTARVPDSKIYKDCQEREIVFESNTFGYSLCLPEYWADKYATENKDRTITFNYEKDGQSADPVFAIRVMPSSYWKENKDLLSDLVLLGEDDGRVFLGKFFDEAGVVSHDARRMIADAKRVASSIAFAGYKSIERSIEDFLTTKARVTKGGRPFITFEILGREEKNNAFRYFIWLYSREYVFDGRSLRSGSEMSVPLAVTVESGPGGYRVAGLEGPRSGDSFFEDIAAIFPERIVKSEWFNQDFVYLNAHVEVLSQMARAKAREMYKIDRRKILGFILGMPTEETRTYFEIDEASWLLGEAARIAMVQMGRCVAGDKCLSEGGRLLFNPEVVKNKYLITPDTLFSIVGKSGKLENISTSDFIYLFPEKDSKYPTVPFWIELENDTITSAKEELVGEKDKR